MKTYTVAFTCDCEATITVADNVTLEQAMEQMETGLTLDRIRPKYMNHFEPMMTWVSPPNGLENVAVS